MIEFLKATAWPMQPPKRFGAFHIVFALVGIALSVLIAWLLRNTNDKQNRIVFGVVGGYLLIAETYKELFYYYIIGNGTYPWWIIPFQLCSIAMYLCIFVAFCKNEKINNVIYNFMFSVNMFGGLISLISPSGLNLPYVTMTVHSYIWHILLVFIGLYLFFSKRACNNVKEYFQSLIGLAAYTLFAQIINVVLRDKGVSMFFISPYTPSPLPFFSWFYVEFGWVANMILYLIAIVIATAAIFFAFYLARHLKTKKKAIKNG